MTAFNTPVLLLVFNRPHQTKKVFDVIREMRPKQLFVAADGPRKGKDQEYDLCEQVRVIVTDIDWDCEIKTLFRDYNRGCKHAVSSAITWFFEHVEEGIILEDDCLPNTSFFSYCEQLLQKYRDDQKMMHITASNLNDNLKFGNGDYYVSRYAHIWGWATWRRAWKNYDVDLQNTSYYTTLINTTFKYHSERLFWNSRLQLIKDGIIDTWDYQWLFSIWRANGISLNSNYNLVENIGFGAEATHTTGKSNYINAGTRVKLKFAHPTEYSINEKAEREFMRNVHGIERRGYFRYFFNKYVAQRYLNLLHKIQLAQFGK